MGLPELITALSGACLQIREQCRQWEALENNSTGTGTRRMHRIVNMREEHNNTAATG